MIYIDDNGNVVTDAETVVKSINENDERLSYEDADVILEQMERVW